MYSRIIFILLILTSFYIEAKPIIAKVKRIKGRVTVLAPGALISKTLSLDEKLYADSSIVTAKGSFARIVYNDGSVINIAPKSKILLVAFENKNRIGVVSLLKGKLRAVVNKNRNEKTSKNKFFVKTRTAAMGVRGTEFQAVYNPQNELTSLLTFKGKVAMVKVDEKKLSYNVGATANADEENIKKEQVDKIKKNWKTTSDVSELNQLLEAKDTVIVKQGQYSGALKKLDATTLPVKISPTQFTALYHNKDFSEKETGVKVTKLVKQAKQDAPIDGFYDKKSGKMAPRAGGFLDSKTGIYVPPTKNSLLIKRLGVYESKAIGTVSEATGKYIPPVGLKLNAIKGFVVDPTFTDKVKDKQVLIAVRNDLNGVIAKELIIHAPVEVVSSYAPTVAKVFRMNTFYFSQKGYESDLGFTSENNNKMDINVDDMSISEFRWNHSTETLWQITNTFQLKAVPDEYYYQFGAFDSSSHASKLFSMGIGFQKILGKSSFYGFEGKLDQQNVAGMFEGATVINQLSFLKARTYFNTRFFTSKRFYMDFDLGFSFLLPKEKGLFDVTSGYGFNLGVGMNYWLSSTYALKIGVWHETQFLKVEGSVDPYELERNDGGLDINLSFLF